MNERSNTIVAIIPAAGKAKRLASLPFSKELFPVSIKGDDGEVTVISKYLINNLLHAGIENLNFVIRHEKSDIIKHYKGGLDLSCHISYHIAEYEYGVPFSINQVYPFIKNNNVAFGFPDIYIKPLDLFERLKNSFKQNNNIDVLLGLIPISDYRSWDMVELDEDNKVQNICLHNDSGESLKYGWCIALWRPSFSSFLNNYIEEKLVSETEIELEKNEFSIGSIFQKAIEAGLNVKGLPFDDAICIDAGTYIGLEKVKQEIRKNQNQNK